MNRVPSEFWTQFGSCPLILEEPSDFSEKLPDFGVKKNCLLISQLMSGKRSVLSGTNLFRFSWCQVHLAWRCAQRAREVGRFLDGFLSRVQRGSARTPCQKRCCVVYTEELNVSGAKSGNNTLVSVFLSAYGLMGKQPECFLYLRFKHYCFELASFFGNTNTRSSRQLT